MLLDGIAEYADPAPMTAPPAAPPCTPPRPRPPGPRWPPGTRRPAAL